MTQTVEEMVKRLRAMEHGYGLSANEACAFKQAADLLTAKEAERAALARRVEELEKRVQQLHDKMTCMCGSPMDHSTDEGHTPVSMYDYYANWIINGIITLIALLWLFSIL